MTATVLAFGAPTFGDGDKAALWRAQARLREALRTPVSVEIDRADEGGEYAILAVDAAQGEIDAWSAYRVLALVQPTRQPGRRWAVLREDGREIGAGNDLDALLLGVTGA